MYRIKAELEDTSLKYLNEEEYYEISKSLDSKKSERINDIDLMVEKLKEILNKHNFEYGVNSKLKKGSTFYFRINL